MNRIFWSLAVLVLSATLSFAQTPDRSSTPNTNPNAPASNEPVHNGGNWGWIGLIGLAGLAGMRGRREDIRTDSARVRPAA